MIADDIPSLCTRYAGVLSQADDIEVVAIANNGYEAILKSAIAQPDVILMDIEMESKYAGITATRQLLSQFPGIKVVILTVYEEDTMIYAAFQAGACDYIQKTATPAMMIQCVRDAYALYCKGRDKATAKKDLEKKHYAKLESLAKLLFRPTYCQNLKYGDLTIADFVFYQQDALFVKELPDTRKRMLGSLKNTIMPVIGGYHLKDFDTSRQEKALRTINRNLRKSGARLSRCGYVKRAYLGLLQSIESSGWTGCTPGMRLVHIIGSAREANYQILKSARVCHLDEDQRRAFFDLLNHDHLYELFLVSLIYSGLAPSEIAAARYGDFNVLVLSNNCRCYTLLVTQRVRKLHHRFSTLSATNQDYPIEKLRKIVLPPWAGEILNRRLNQIRASGIEDNQIREMRLSSIEPGDAIVGPDEIASRLNPLLHEAGIKDTSARSLPYDFLHTACVTGAISGQLGILAYGGLRISELAGLLFSCLHAIETSQGTLYYIEINGQLTPSGKRTEITKTAASYRIVPLSPELGQELIHQRKQLEEQFGDVAFRLMCGQASIDEYIDTPAQAASWQKKVGERIPELLRSTRLIDAMVSERAYIFNLDVQNKHLFSMLTCHALRRNYCTWLYCYSGLCTSEIYRLMGHSDKTHPKSSSEGLTDTDLRRICLQNYVSHTLYHTPGSLTYSLSSTIRSTEVPACNVNLILPPKATINLILEDTEPANKIHYSAEGILVEEAHQEKTRNPQYDYSLLASDEVWSIKDKHKLLD